MLNRKGIRKTAAVPLAPAYLDELLDEALKQTFPASDAVAIDIERTTDRRQDIKSAPSVDSWT